MAWWNDILDFVTDNASSIIPAVTSVVGNEASRGANNEAAQAQIRGAQEAADITSAGIAEALDIDLDTVKILKDTLGDRFEAVTDLLKQAPAEYRQQILQAVKDSAQLSTQGVDQFGNKVEGAAGQYGRETDAGVDRLSSDFGAIGNEYEGRVNQAMTEAATLMQDGTVGFQDALAQVSQKYGLDMSKVASDYAAQIEKAQGEFAPLKEAGAEALQTLRGVAAGDAGDLTSTQQRTRDKIRRQSINNLAAAGMRGAGRAGIAAVNEADATYRAQAEDQNQRRIDQAVSALFGGGNQAASAIASLIAKGGDVARGIGTDVAGMDASLTRAGADAGLATDKALAQLGYSAGTDVAKTLGDLGRVVAGQRLSTTQGNAQTRYGAATTAANAGLTNSNAIANNLLTAGSSAASKDFDTTNRLAGETGSVYDKLMALATSEGGAMSGAVRQTAGAQAAAKQGASVTDAQRILANGSLTGSNAGAIASVFARPRQVASAATAGA